MHHILERSGLEFDRTITLISRIYYSLICLKILFYSANKNAAFYPNKIAPHVYPCNFSGQGHCCDYENHTRCIDNPNRPV